MGCGSRSSEEVEHDRLVPRARAASGDVVLIAGKGHERTQEFAGDTVEFDDRAVAREALEARS